MSNIYVFNHRNCRKLIYDIYNHDDLRELESKLTADVVAEGGDLNINLNMNNYDKKLLAELEAISKRLPKNLNVSFTIDNRNTTMKCAELENFIDFEESLKKQDQALYFNAGLDDYELSEVISAQEQIESFSKKINALDASPLEKYLIIYDFLTSKIYNESELSASKSRDIIAVLNGNNIVCVGYSRMLERLCEEAGIECYGQACEVRSKFDKDYLERHRNNIVRIKDEKYGIDGMFYADACWDAVRKGKEHKKTYMYALLPFADVDKMRYANIDVLDKAIYQECPSSVECDRRFIGEIHKFGIDTRTWPMVDKKDYLDFKKRRRALKRVEKLFKSNNIPADIYLKDGSSAEICSFERFVALCMEDKMDEERIKESILALQSVANPSKDKEERNVLLDPIEFDFFKKEDEDIYKRIQEMKNAENRVEASHYEFDDKYTFDQVVEIIKTEGPEIARQKTGLKKVVKKIKPEFPYEFKSAMEAHDKILNGRRMAKEVQNLKGLEEVIPLETLEKALRRSYELRGMSPEKVDYEVDRALTDTIAKSREVFDKNAINCFSKAANSTIYFEK